MIAIMDQWVWEGRTAIKMININGIKDDKTGKRSVSKTINGNGFAALSKMLRLLMINFDFPGGKCLCGRPWIYVFVCYHSAVSTCYPSFFRILNISKYVINYWRPGSDLRYGIFGISQECCALGPHLYVKAILKGTHFD